MQPDDISRSIINRWGRSGSAAKGRPQRMSARRRTVRVEWGR
jgi:hypothetical protein